MARLFVEASSEKINLSLGAGGSVTGASTLAVIGKLRTNPSSIGAACNAMAIGRFNGDRWNLAISTGDKLQLNGSNSTTSFQVADGWGCLVTTHAAGTTTPRLHIYKYATGTWTHENGSATVANQAPSSTSCIGANASDGAARWDGDLAVLGVWAAEFTDAQVESLAYGLSAWFQVQPNGLWLLDQSSTSMKVNDITGNGANQTAITGTSVSTSSVPVFSYGHQPLIPQLASPPITVTPPPTPTTSISRTLVLGRGSGLGHRQHSIRTPVGVSS